MKEFLSKVPHGWWEEFRSRCMTTCNLTYEQWKNRVCDRSQVTEAERIVMRNIFAQMQKEFQSGKEIL